MQIRDIRFVTQDGGLMRALLYIPRTASPETPVPAVVAMHGYNNTAEMQDINAIELSRRGIVVLAFDSYAHGHSSYPDSRVNNGFVQDLGTFAALQYLKTLPYVDPFPGGHGGPLHGRQRHSGRRVARLPGSRNRSLGGGARGHTAHGQLLHPGRRRQPSAGQISREPGFGIRQV